MLLGLIQFIKSDLVDINLRQYQALVSKHIGYFLSVCFLSMMTASQSHSLSYTKVYDLSMFTRCLTFQWGQVRGEIRRLEREREGERERERERERAQKMVDSIGPLLQVFTNPEK